MGALLALHVAADLPHRVRRMLLMSATPRFTRHVESGWLAGLSPAKFALMKRRLADQRREALADFHYAMLARGDFDEASDPQALVAATGERWSPGESKWSTEALAAGLDLLRTLDVRDRVAQVSIPVLLVHGVDDLICPVEAGRWLAGHLPQAELIELPGAGHVPFWDQDSAVDQRVEAFFLDNAE